MYINRVMIVVFVILLALIAYENVLLINRAKTQEQEIHALRTITANHVTDMIAFKNALSILDKAAIKKNDYNVQTCITIKEDGSEYIPVIVKDENTKKLKKERGEIEDWDKRTAWTDLSSLTRKIEKVK